LKLVQLLVFFSFLSVYAQGITVSSGETSEQMVNMLLNNACVEVTNINMSSNIAVSGFSNNGSDFPIQEGVILRSGEAQFTSGIYTGENLSSQENSNGDPDLQEIANSSGQTTPITDVAFLQFDFTPISNNVSFDFLFASNEYGEFQCISNDAMGFILTNLNTNESVNLGVIPQTAVPVSVKNIRDNAFNASCVSDNEEFFQTYNVNNPENSTLNMRGHTQVISTNSELQPGVPYRIRFLVGDSNDADFDSAVFLAAGSFETTLDLGEDETLCANETVTLNTEVDSSQYGHTWIKDGEEIPGETDSSYTVTEGGTYQVIITNNEGNCVVTDEIFFNQFLVGQPTDIEFCIKEEGQYVLPLAVKAYSEIITGFPLDNYEIAYFLSLEDAENYENPILLEDLGFSGNYSIDVGFGTTTIYVVIESLDGSDCYVIFNFNVIENPLPELPEDIEDAIGCIDYILPPLEGDNHYENSLGTILEAGTAVTESGSYFIVTPENEFGCTNRVAFSVSLIIDFELPPTSCGQFLVPVPPEGTFFYTEIDGPNGEGEIIEPGTIYTEDVVIYYYAEVDGEICKNEAIPKTILPAPDLPNFQDVLTCEPYVLPPLDVDVPDEYVDYYYQPNGNGATVPPGTIIDGYQTIYVYAEVGSCEDQKLFTVKVVPEFEDIEECAEYTLPTLPNSLNYFTLPEGGGNPIAADSTLTLSQTIFIYAQTSGPNCTDHLSFDLTIFEAPPVDSLQNAPLACEEDFYTLPPLTNGNYYTAPNGMGNQLQPGLVITEPQTIYIFNEGGGCTNETFFDVEIDFLPILENFSDVFECNSYTLPTPAQGNFFTGTLGSGEMLNGGDEITDTQLIYLYIDAGPNSPCFQEKAFTVNIVDADIVGDNPDVQACDEYTLPPLSEGDYFTQSGGTGTMLSAGTTITSSQEIFVYLEKGDRESCVSEDNFIVTISTTPTLPNFQDEEACGSFTLPSLATIPTTNVGYFWQPNGNDPISSEEFTFTEPGTYTVYVYAEANGNPNCNDQEQFEITIYPLLNFEVEGGTICLDPETGEVISPVVLSSGIDESQFQIQWCLNGTLMHTGAEFIAEQAGEYTVQTIKLTPEIGADCNYNPTTVTVNTSSIPVLEAEVSEDFSEVSTINVTVVSGDGEYLFQLNNGSFQTNGFFENIASGEHTVTVIDTNGCGEVSITVDVLNYPRFFTPNSDGINDTWSIPDLNNNQTAVIYIHDRFGKLLTSFSPSRGRWDGIYNDKKMPSNDYWFRVVYTKEGNKKEFMAHFTLKR